MCRPSKQASPCYRAATAVAGGGMAGLEAVGRGAMQAPVPDRRAGSAEGPTPSGPVAGTGLPNRQRLSIYRPSGRKNTRSDLGKRPAKPVHRAAPKIHCEKYAQGIRSELGGSRWDAGDCCRGHHMIEDAIGIGMRTQGNDPAARATSENNQVATPAGSSDVD